MIGAQGRPATIAQRVRDPIFTTRSPGLQTRHVPRAPFRNCTLEKSRRPKLLADPPHGDPGRHWARGGLLIEI